MVCVQKISRRDGEASQSWEAVGLMALFRPLEAYILRRARTGLWRCSSPGAGSLQLAFQPHGDRELEATRYCHPAPTHHPSLNASSRPLRMLGSKTISRNTKLSARKLAQIGRSR